MNYSCNMIKIQFFASLLISHGKQQFGLFLDYFYLTVLHTTERARVTMYIVYVYKTMNSYIYWHTCARVCIVFVNLLHACITVKYEHVRPSTYPKCTKIHLSSTDINN